MRFHARISLLALLTGAIIAVLAPAAAQAAFGVESFDAVNCSETHEACGGEEVGPYSFPKEPDEAEAVAQAETQAGGHVPYGITDFKVTTTGAFPNEVPVGLPGGAVTHLRTDVAPGLATNPSAVPQCSEAEFGTAEAVTGTGFYAASKCKASTKAGVNKVTLYAGPNGAGPGVADLPLEGIAYNLVQKEGLALEFGVALEIPQEFSEAVLQKAFTKLEEEGHPVGEPTEKFLEEQQYFAHSLIEGNVEWGQQEKGTNVGDYHDYFEVKVSPALPLISNRLVFYGRSGEGDLITNATRCPGANTSTLHLEDAEGAKATRTYTTLVGLTGCNEVPFELPFEPSFSVAPTTPGHDEPTGLTAEVGLPRHPKATEIDSSQLKTAVIRLPEGMTLDPSAAHGLEACTPAQARIHSSVAGTSCPKGSELGTVELEVPTLPAGSLKGSIYLGGPESGPITGPPYVIYLDAESTRYGVSVRVKGKTVPNETTGQLTATFSENPEQPFTKVTMHFKEGALAPLANPLSCGSATATAAFSPFTETASKSGESAFAVTGCPSPLQFTPSQGTENEIANAGAHTNYTFTLQRSEGQQYLSQVKTELPAGLVGAIPTVPLCTEAQANAESCPAESLIGKTTVTAGSGPTPFSLSGSVYLTGPYNGAPYGLFISVPVVAGPFNLGNAITRATINVDPTTARVIVASNLPTIVRGGVPVRLRSVSVDLDRPGFLSNPTSCGVLATESTVTGLGTPGTSVSLSTPFQVGNCSALPFKPSFRAATSAKTSKANGASLETTVNQPAGQANIKSVLVQLPKQLPSRLTTLQKACPEATFAANPLSCPKGSLVGGARANTPLLPNKLTGPAYLVSHGGAAFPDLDIVLQADGVRVILVGNTNIKGGITTTNFATTPDVPVSSITLNLPIGAHSALAAYGELCAQPLVMPTTITAQDGSTLKQNTIIKVAGCGVRIVGHKVIGNTAYLTVRTFAAGRISGRGSNLATSYRYLGKPEKTATLKVPLSSRGKRRGRPLRVRLRVGFLAKQRGIPSSAAFVTVTFR
jgi:hypothetical protein